MKQTILFVCTGNTCRSPMAEGFARAEFEKHSLPYRAKSAGIFPTDQTANGKSIRAIASYGIDLSSHQTRRLTGDEIAQAERILTMTQDQEALLKQAFPFAKDKISVISPEGIPDPYGGTQEDYEVCAKALKLAVERLTEELKHEAETCDH